MYYGLVYYPSFEPGLVRQIRQIRAKYDPTVDLIEPHLTVMFPVPESVGEHMLIDHIQGVLQQWKPFPIHVCRTQKSWDHWLLLTLQEGNAEVIKLYGEIYTGILAEYRRDDLEFIPHIALGLFAKNAAEYDFNDPRPLEFDQRGYDQALREVEALAPDFHYVVDKLHLLKLTEDFSRIVATREFPVGGDGAERGPPAGRAG